MSVAPYAVGPGAGTPQNPWVEVSPGVYSPPTPVAPTPVTPQPPPSVGDGMGVGAQGGVPPLASPVVPGFYILPGIPTPIPYTNPINVPPGASILIPLMPIPSPTPSYPPSTPTTPTPPRITSPTIPPANSIGGGMARGAQSGAAPLDLPLSLSDWQKQNPQYIAMFDRGLSRYNLYRTQYLKDTTAQSTPQLVTVYDESGDAYKVTLDQSKDFAKTGVLPPNAVPLDIAQAQALEIQRQQALAKEQQSERQTSGAKRWFIDTLKEAVTLGKIETSTYDEKGIAQNYQTAVQKVAAIYNGDYQSIDKLYSAGNYANYQDYLTDRNAAIQAGTGQKTIPLNDFTQQTLGTQEQYRAQVLQSQPSGGSLAKNIVLNSIPVYGTIRTWNQMGMGGKALSIALDALWIIPFVGGVAAGARAVEAITTGERIAATLGATRDIAIAEIKAPLTAITHPIQTAKAALEPIETALRPSKLPLAGLEIKYSAQRIPIVGSIEETRALRNAVTDAAIRGDTARATAESGLILELEQPMALGNIRPAVIHASPDITPFREGAIIGVKDSGELYLAPSAHTRFSTATAFGAIPENGEKGILLIRDNKIISQLQSGEKTYKGTFEVEKTLPVGTQLEKPIQELMTRDAAGNRLTVLVYGEKLSPVDIAKFKLVGSADTLRDLFAPNLKIKAKAAIDGGRSAELTQEVLDALRELNELGYGAERAMSVAAGARATILIERINAARAEIATINAGRTEYAAINTTDRPIVIDGREEVPINRADIIISPTQRGEIVIAGRDDDRIEQPRERIPPDRIGRIPPLTERVETPSLDRVSPPLPERGIPPSDRITTPPPRRGTPSPSRVMPPSLRAEVPPYKETLPPKITVIPPLPPSGSKSKEISQQRWYKKDGLVTWHQGEIMQGRNLEIVWHLYWYPYEEENQDTWVDNTPPEGAMVINTNRASQTIQLLKGTAPEGTKRVNVGAVNALVTGTGGNEVSLTFESVKKQKGYTSASIRGSRKYAKAKQARQRKVESGMQIW